ncbi:MAG TPA: EamA family transporter [Humibacter sp.]|jgi:drug/metabolite transporter (DMT)-like permease|nr:EamA family transporter [Humibacter sp.]
MGALLGLIAAIAYGASDFVAGLASRRSTATNVTAIALVVELLASVVATIIFPGSGPTAHALIWGAVSGIGSAVGTLALYQGFAVGRMSIVATLAGVLTVVVPAAVGILLGNRVSVLMVIGLAAAVVAVGLTSWTPRSAGRGRSGALYGVIAGAAFALLFIALDRAGTASGAWPLTAGQVVACLLVAPLVLRGLRSSPPSKPAVWLSVVAGLTGGIAGLVYLVATGFGELVVVAVITAMYPAATVLLARFVLHEHWTRMHVAGLILSVVAVLAVALG